MWLALAEVYKKTCRYALPLPFIYPESLLYPYAFSNLTCLSLPLSFSLSRPFVVSSRFSFPPQRISESIKCHERALLGAALNSILSTLADLHQTTGSASSAAACHRRLLANHSSAGSGGPLGEMVRSYLFLAKYELEGGDARGAAGKEGGRGGMGEGEEPNWGLAQQYLQQVVIHVRVISLSLLRSSTDRVAC
jgi:hypothetical protein